MFHVALQCPTYITPNCLLILRVDADETTAGLVKVCNSKHLPRSCCRLPLIWCRYLSMLYRTPIHSKHYTKVIQSELMKCYSVLIHCEYSATPCNIQTSMHSMAQKKSTQKWINYQLIYAPIDACAFACI